MFPPGMAGVALVVLRSVVAITLIADTSRRSFLNSAPIVDIFAALIGLCLCLGFLTPYCSALTCLLELTLLATNETSNHLHIGMSALTACAQMALGPGAYSLDARLFGRQLIKLPSKPDWH
jgi:uncharacterized membrane protein YphA (DoxX/SURF4 family)